VLEEFKKFIMRGNVMDLAIGVIIGGAFALITKSLVGDVIMPIVGAIFGQRPCEYPARTATILGIISFTKKGKTTWFATASGRTHIRNL